MGNNFIGNSFVKFGDHLVRHNAYYNISCALAEMHRESGVSYISPEVREFLLENNCECLVTIADHARDIISKEQYKLDVDHLTKIKECNKMLLKSYPGFTFLINHNLLKVEIANAVLDKDFYDKLQMNVILFNRLYDNLAKGLLNFQLERPLLNGDTTISLPPIDLGSLSNEFEEIRNWNRKYYKDYEDERLILSTIANFVPKLNLMHRDLTMACLGVRVLIEGNKGKLYLLENAGKEGAEGIPVDIVNGCNFRIPNVSISKDGVYNFVKMLPGIAYNTTIVLTAGALTFVVKFINDVRKAMGLEPLGNGDSYEADNNSSAVVDVEYKEVNDEPEQKDVDVTEIKVKAEAETQALLALPCIPMYRQDADVNAKEDNSEFIIGYLYRCAKKLKDNSYIFTDVKQDSETYGVELTVSNFDIRTIDGIHYSYLSGLTEPVIDGTYICNNLVPLTLEGEISINKFTHPLQNEIKGKTGIELSDNEVKELEDIFGDNSTLSSIIGVLGSYTAEGCNKNEDFDKALSVLLGEFKSTYLLTVARDEGFGVKWDVALQDTGIEVTSDDGTDIDTWIKCTIPDAPIKASTSTKKTVSSIGPKSAQVLSNETLKGNFANLKAAVNKQSSGHIEVEQHVSTVEEVIETKVIHNNNVEKASHKAQQTDISRTNVQQVSQQQTVDNKLYTNAYSYYAEFYDTLGKAIRSLYGRDIQGEDCIPALLDFYNIISTKNQNDFTSSDYTNAEKLAISINRHYKQMFRNCGLQIPTLPELE